MLQTPPYTRLADHPPVIVVGMHRSGTSLLCRLLNQLGVHLGNDQGAINAESRHFRALNERILRAAGGRWNEPEPVLEALQSSAFRQTWTTYLRDHMLSGWGGFRYWGASVGWNCGEGCHRGCGVGRTRAPHSPWRCDWGFSLKRTWCISSATE